MSNGNKFGNGQKRLPSTVIDQKVDAVIFFFQFHRNIIN